MRMFDGSEDEAEAKQEPAATLRTSFAETDTADVDTGTISRGGITDGNLEELDFPSGSTSHQRRTPSSGYRLVSSVPSQDVSISLQFHSMNRAHFQTKT